MRPRRSPCVLLFSRADLLCIRLVILRMAVCCVHYIHIMICRRVFFFLCAPWLLLNGEVVQGLRGSVNNRTAIISDSVNAAYNRLSIRECNCGQTDISLCLHAFRSQTAAALSPGLDSWQNDKAALLFLCTFWVLFNAFAIFNKYNTKKDLLDLSCAWVKTEKSSAFTFISHS